MQYSNIPDREKIKQKRCQKTTENVEVCSFIFIIIKV